MLRCTAWWVAAICLLGGCQAVSKPEDLYATWARAPKRLPAAATRSNEAVFEYTTPHYDAWLRSVSAQVVKPGVKVPAVLFLHGCAGLTNASTWGGHFVRKGFAFFAPDSFARPGRVSNCGGPTAQSLRVAELDYALGKIRGIDWIDQRRLLLVGFSEGAFTAAQYQGTDFAAIVLLGIDCRHTGGAPLAPASVPVLNLVGSLDNYGFERGCLVNRSVGGSKSVVLQGIGHAVEGDARAFDVVDEFLRQSGLLF